MFLNCRGKQWNPEGTTQKPEEHANSTKPGLFFFLVFCSTFVFNFQIQVTQKQMSLSTVNTCQHKVI